MKKCRVGFIHGSFDMFNIGDLRAIEIAKEQCENLIVGIYTDEMMLANSQRASMIPYEDQMKIVNAIKGVDSIVEISSPKQLEKRDELKAIIKAKGLSYKEDLPERRKYEVGFIQGTFDMFHIGHLRLIERAKNQCQQLIVGVNTDELVQSYKKKTPIVGFEERLRIVEAIKGVDRAIGIDDRDKIRAAKELGFNVLIMGNDWKGSEFYNSMEEKLKQIGVDTVYLPYTQGISSTILRKRLGKDANGNNINEGNSGR